MERWWSIESANGKRGTEILRKDGSENFGASDELLPIVYQELRSLARSRMFRERPGHTLQTTALVHEAYLRLVDGNQPKLWDCRGHFFAAAAEAMRRILVESARRKATAKRGKGRERVTLEGVANEKPVEPIDLLAMDEALKKLEQRDPRQAMMIKLRYFAGLSIREVAEEIGVCERTVERELRFASAWLLVEGEFS